jgi:hypothetical protein
VFSRDRWVISEPAEVDPIDRFRQAGAMLVLAPAVEPERQSFPNCSTVTPKPLPAGGAANLAGPIGREAIDAGQDANLHLETSHPFYKSVNGR